MRGRGVKLSREIKNFFLFVIISLVFLGFDSWGFLGLPRDVFETVFNPIKRGAYLVSSHSNIILGMVFNIEDTFERDRKYKKATEEKDKLTQQVKTLTAENDSLRKQLESPLPPNWKYIPVRVIGVNRYLQVWGGTRSGIKPGMSVISGIYYVGKVVSASASTSQVLLPSDPAANIPAVSQRGTRGVVGGKFGEKIYLEGVLQKDELFIGDQIFTTGEDDYAPGLIIGEIAAVEARDFEVYKRGEIKISENTKNVTNIFVVSEF
ncbi:hypothetical protein A2773_06350 [Candidatus Gottesmanbacteria bacterium RIFCSPHIGHO2_01_FULL_39_10]|uniref:Cell shape-determining protein MreC n=1 Tax=Candidatus Gottesmanbacteria bacterium RIFCSPHIGHO2_01_FULL_39_10 TaxID=1798375 RepID=A0A1F5ZPF0_9BACT|nr:MAG: hypothetical protein A2773_06350 [Candidatus Gottesmanbacteria bacterium RIFCSPHIGHO2_01_FULL_39_10]